MAAALRGSLGRVADSRSSALPQGFPASVERVASFLTSLGHEPAPSVAMAANLLETKLSHPQKQLVRRHLSLTMTPQERNDLALMLQARRVLVEGTLLSLDGNDVREGTVLSAHALCEAREARRPVTLRFGTAVAQAEQIHAARQRLIGELDSIDLIVEAATAEDEDLVKGAGGGSPNPRVVHLQNRLNMLGHRVAADGKFGDVTHEAVKDFQARAGMDPTGVVDNDTTLALRHGRRVVEVGPAAVMAPEDAAKLKDVGDGDPNKETGNSASQTAPGPTGKAGEVADAKPVPASKRVAALMKLLQGLEGLQEAGYSAAREQKIFRTRRELAEAELSAKSRGDLDDDDFALPGRRYPIHDESHARNALSRVAQHGSDDEKEKVRAAVHRKYPSVGKTEESRMDEASIKRCATCRAPMRNQHVCQRGHRQPKLSEGAQLGQAEKDELRDADGEWVSARKRSEEKKKKDAPVLDESRVLQESPQTAALSVTHAPIGKGGTNWVTKSKPGNTGQLPAYIQNVRNAIMRGGKSESEATAIAVGRIRDWAEGKGGVSAEVKAAAAKAIAEWEAMRGAAHAKSGAKKLSEADSTADFPETMRCPTCGARAKVGGRGCPRGHSLESGKTLMHALVRSVQFDRDAELLLRECEELRETWEAFDAQRHQSSWGKLVKSGPMPGTWKDSPGRGPTGKLRNFNSMSPPKLAATLEALAVHGEDHEAHHAAMYAAGEKLGMKITGRSAPVQDTKHPDQKVHELLTECRCGAPVREGAQICQRGHRLEEWSPQSREAALLARHEGSGVKKNYYTMQNVGKARHVVNFHDGVKTHEDGSPFYDMHIASNKRERDAFVGGLQRSGYEERSGPVTGSFKPRPATALRQRGQ